MTVDEQVEVLRSAAAWARRAADLLEVGDLDGAEDAAALAVFGVEGAAERMKTTT